MIGGDLGAMLARHAAQGRIEGIFVRPERRAPVHSILSASVTFEGLGGDHARAGKRAITLLQEEHLAVISALLGRRAIEPQALRRNILVSGINLLALRKTEIKVGGCRLFIHGPCPPCSRMEETFGHGGYSAVRGHGGVYAEVIEPGDVSVGSHVERCAAQ